MVRKVGRSRQSIIRFDIAKKIDAIYVSIKWDSLFSARPSGLTYHFVELAAPVMLLRVIAHNRRSIAINSILRKYAH